MGRQTQDGGVGGRRVRISSQLGHLPDAGGGARHPRVWEEPPKDKVEHGRGSEGGGEVEVEWDWHP